MKDLTIALTASAVIVILTFLVIGSLVYGFNGFSDQRKCIKSHEVTRHRPAYTTHVLVGKILVPQVHPAREYQETVCDEYEDGDAR